MNKIFNFHTFSKYLRSKLERSMPIMTWIINLQNVTWSFLPGPRLALIQQKMFPLRLPLQSLDRLFPQSLPLQSLDRQNICTRYQIQEDTKICLIIKMFKLIPLMLKTGWSILVSASLEYRTRYSICMSRPTFVIFPNIFDPISAILLFWYGLKFLFTSVMENCIKRFNIKLDLDQVFDTVATVIFK